MNTTIKYSLEVVVHKRGDMIYFSQLDLIHVLERALRRTDLPVYFTQGFTPRVKISFHGGLKLGQEGDIPTTLFFNTPHTVEQVQAALGPQLPEGLAVYGPRS